MTKCVILAGGVPGASPRHLAFPLFRFRRVIEYSLRGCIQSGLGTAIVCDQKNNKLIKFLEHRYKRVRILHPRDQKMISSFKAAFEYDDFEEDKIILAGDLLNINPSDIQSLANLAGQDAISTLKKPFKDVPHIDGIDGALKLRTDVGLGVFRLSRESQRAVLNPEFLQQSIKLRERFYGNKTIDEGKANDIWTWLLFNLFNEVYGHSQGRPKTGKQVLVDLKIDSANDYD